MTPFRLNFTKAAIEALPAAPKGKRTYVYDTHPKAKGLAVAVTDKGVKSFIVYRWIDGRPERITLGRCAQGPLGGLTIEQARKLASDTNVAIAHGENPAQKKRAGREEMTLGELFEDYMTKHAEVHNRRPEKPRNHYRLYLSPWGSRRLSHIKKADVQALHAKLGRERGRVTANVAVKLLRSIFNRAIEWELWAKPNPATGIRLFPEDSRERFLQPDELPRFFKALAAEENETIRDYLFVSLLTGARRGNVLAMRWEEVNLERGEWRIPTTKSGKPHVVPLLPEAVGILKRRLAERDAVAARKAKAGGAREKADASAEYVFPGSGAGGHLIEPKKGWRRVLDRAELYQLVEWLTDAQVWDDRQAASATEAADYGKALKEARTAVKAMGKDPGPARFHDIRPHDLRRTLGSWQAATGASLPVIGRSLGHRNISTTAIYARLSLDPVREAMQRAASAMLAAGGVTPKAQVVALKRPGRAKR